MDKGMQQQLPRGAAFCNGRNSTAIVPPKNNITTNISAESYAGEHNGGANNVAKH